MQMLLPKVFMFDFTDDWTQLPSLNTGRHEHGCGLARKLDGTIQAVVAGGVDEESVEIYDFATGHWRYKTN